MRTESFTKRLDDLLTINKYTHICAHEVAAYSIYSILANIIFYRLIICGKSL